MQDYKALFKGKQITLMGLGLLGRGLGDARFLAELGAELIVTDLKNEEMLKDSLKQLKEFTNITYHLGGHRLEDFRDRDLVVKAAGVPLDSPFIAEAKKNTIPVRMSADLFAEFAGLPLVGVTGTRGKSTVAHMIAHILKTSGKKVLLGGNVRGVSTLALLKEVTPDAIAVLELDSWQLQGFGEAKISPHVAVFTTFFDDHLNYYKNDRAAYLADKAHIFLYQKSGDAFVLGEQAAKIVIESYGDRMPVRPTVRGILATPYAGHLRVLGIHNHYDAALAEEAAFALGTPYPVSREALATFPGVPGRLELIKEVRGVKIYNDTTATTPEATVAALEALDPAGKKNIVLIMGGADKGLDMSRLAATIPQHCKTVLLLAGTGTERIKNDMNNTSIYQSLSEAVEVGFKLAEAGDSILLSPAFASFGMFKNEYDRGEQFLKAAESLES